MSGPCPECEAEYNLEVLRYPKGGSDFPPCFCPFCKAIVVETRSRKTNKEEGDGAV